MILLDAKAETNTKAPNFLSLIDSSVSKEGKAELSFVELLKGIELNSNKENTPIKFIPLKDTPQAKDEIKTNIPLKTSNTELNPLLTKDISLKELKELVVDAKKYLKSSIVQSSDYKINEAKQLPQTLKGLVDVAEKLGLDIQKITYEDIRPTKKTQIQVLDGSKIKTLLDSKKSDTQELKKTNIDIKTENKSEIRAELKTTNADIKTENKSEVRAELKTTNADIKTENKSEIRAELKTTNADIKTENKSEVRAELKTTNADIKTENKSEVKAELKTTNADIKIENKSEVRAELKTTNADIKTENKSEVRAELKTTNADIKTENKSEVKAELKTTNADIKTENKSEVRAELKTTNADIKTENKSEVRAELKTTNADIKVDVREKTKSSIFLFKEAISIPQKILTQDIVDVKNNLIQKDTNQTLKTSKQKTDETLKLLLRGEKPQQTLNSSLTSDFSVASAKVIAPTTTIDTSRSLEALLHSKPTTDTNNDVVTEADKTKVLKSDSFEVKVNEAKQMVKYLSADVKTAIEDYKSPFTRIKVQLNPQNLGAIDLTVVQRGKNLHVNLTSNNAAINALALNVNDLKVQLSNNGINNATFNFNSGSENSSSNNSHQQNSQNSQNRANEEYNYFDNEEQNEEILSSLEIIVPSYA